MKSFDSIRELRNGKIYDTARNTTVNENSISESSSAINFRETNENEVPEIHNLTQEEFNEQIKSFIALLTRQLEDLTHSSADCQSYRVRIIIQGQILTRVVVGLNISPTVWFPQIF